MTSRASKRLDARSAGYDPRIHHRRSIRMRGHDYAGGGDCFVTLCVADRRPLFGAVVKGRMVLNAAGRAAAACWRDIPAHFPVASLDEWIIYDIIIRDARALTNIRRYIRENPAYWGALDAHKMARPVLSVIRPCWICP